MISHKINMFKIGDITTHSDFWQPPVRCEYPASLSKVRKPRLRDSRAFVRHLNEIIGRLDRLGYATIRLGHLHAGTIDAIKLLQELFANQAQLIEEAQGAVNEEVILLIGCVDMITKNQVVVVNSFSTEQ